MPMLVQCPNAACRASCSVGDSSSGNFKCPNCAQPFAMKPTVARQTERETSHNQPSSDTNPFPVLPAEFGRYRILKLLGHGGMGAVYLAQDSQLGRQVALKVPFFNASEAPQRVERFVREARSAAILEHPNICTVFDAGQINGRPFITMAFIAGKPLETAIDPEVPLPQVRAAEIVHKIALALEHAHRKGIVHRDLKPANIMLATNGEPVVMDFGLAKRVADLDPHEAKLTRDGGLLGTPSYMAPEQVKGDVSAIGPTTDVYALGVILFEMLTGRTPYNGSMGSILGQILAAPVPPVTEFRPDVDSRLDAICRKALAKNPAERFPSMAALANVLGFYLKPPASPPLALPTPPVAAVFQAPTAEIVHSPFADLVAASPSTPAPNKARHGQSRLVGLKATKRRLLAAGVIGVALLTLLLAVGLVGLWASGVFKLKTKDGVIVLENLPPDADVTVDGETVTVQSADGKTFEIRVDASKKKHRVEVKKEGVRVFGEEVEVDAGGRKAVLVRLEPKEKTADSGATKVPAEKDLPKTVTIDLGGGVQMEFVLIPKGKFTMGSALTEKHRNKRESNFDAEQPHEVEITKPFYVAKYHMTQEQYEAITGENPSDYSKDGARKDKVLSLNTKRFPVENVSWNDASACCLKMTQSVKPSHRFRLPTEAEWEYACRAGSTTTYFYGDEEESLGEFAYYQANSGGRPHPVGEKKSNKWNLCDMHGLMWEWCADYYGPFDGLDGKDPLRSTKFTEYRRVLRGAGYANPSLDCRAALRNRDVPDHRMNEYGFRICFSPEMDEPLCGKELPSGAAKNGPSDDPDRKAAEYVLSIGGVVRVNDEVDDIKAIADLPHEEFRLTYVDLWGNPKVRNTGLIAFKGCKHLTVLRINETPVKDLGLTYFKDCNNLEILYLHGTDVTDEGLANFKDCKKLQILFLNNTKVTGAGLALFGGCEKLKELSLWKVNVDDAGLEPIFKDSLKLESLNLSHTNVTDATMAHLKSNENLSSLHLSGTRVTDKGMVYLKDCKNLTALSLEGTQQVTDKGMVYLKDCQKLTSLNLSHTTVTDEGLANFKNCKKLRELALHNSQVSDKGLAYFTGCDNLERLSQRDSKVTKAGRDDFRKAHPNCSIDSPPDK